MQRERRIANYLFFCYAGVSMALLSLALSGPVQSFRAVLSYLWTPIPLASSRTVDRAENLSSGVSQLLQADMENRALREELKQMSLLESQLEQERRENERLRASLGLHPDRGREIRWAHVMERDPSNWYRSFMIDAGESGGIEINSPVLGVENGRLGVVGRVTEVGPQWAKVLLITDELSSIAAYIPGKQWEGLLEGAGKPELAMNYLPMEGHIEIGDLVHTSPTSQTFPPDLLVGTVSQIFPDDPFLTSRSVGVVPAVHAGRLKEVLVLKPLKEGLGEAP